MQRNVVAYDEGECRDLEKIVLLSDAISDLPPVRLIYFVLWCSSWVTQFDSHFIYFKVANDEKREKMPFRKEPESEFQKYIRAAKCGKISDYLSFSILIHITGLLPITFLIQEKIVNIWHVCYTIIVLYIIFSLTSFHFIFKSTWLNKFSHIIVITASPWGPINRHDRKIWPCFQCDADILAPSQLYRLIGFYTRIKIFYWKGKLHKQNFFYNSIQ